MAFDAAERKEDLAAFSVRQEKRAAAAEERERESISLQKDSESQSKKSFQRAF